MSRPHWLLPAVVLATTALAGTQTLAQDDPDKLVIGFVPSVESGALVEDIQPLAAYLSEAIGIPVEGYVSSDYAGLVTAMDTGQAHIAADRGRRQEPGQNGAGQHGRSGNPEPVSAPGL